MADDVKIEIGGDTSGAEGSIKDLERSTKKSFEKMATEAEESAKDVSKAFKSAGIRTEKAIRESSAKAKRDFEKIKNSGVASANDIKRAHNAMAAKIKRNNRELATSTGLVSKAFAKLKRHIVLVGAAVVGAFGFTALSESIKLESALIELQKVMGDTEGAASSFSDIAVEMSKKLGVGADVVVLGAATFRRAGFIISEAFFLQEQALGVVKVSELEAAEATEILIATLKGFKAPATEATRLINVLNTTSNKYATDFRELAIGMAEFSPIAKKMGLSFEETAGLLTPVIEVFRSGSEASQALRTGLLKLIDDAGPVREAFHKLGISQTDLNKDMKSGKQILGEVSERFNSLAENQKLVITQQLSGIRQTAKMVEVFDGLSLSTEITNNALEDTNSFAKELAIAMGSTAEKANRAIASFKNLARTIGGPLKKVWNLILDVGIPTMDFLTAKIQGTFNIFARMLDLVGLIDLTDIRKAAEDVARAEEALIQKEKDRANAIKDTNREVIALNKSLEEQKKEINDNLQVDIAAFEIRKTKQKELNALTTEAIRATRKELSQLQAEVQRALAFTQSIAQLIQAGERARSQAGLGATEKLISDLKFAQEDFRKAQEAFAEGNAESARELTRKAVQASVAVLGAVPGIDTENLGVLQEQALKKATAEAEKLTAAAAEFAKEMETAAQVGVSTLTEKLTGLESELEAGENKLSGVLSGIDLAKQKAVDLNKELSAPINKIVNVKVIEGKSRGSESQNVPGFSTGVRLPGYGGGDKILARLEAGEDVIKKESVRSLKRLGKSAMNAIHQGDIQGLIASLPIPGFRNGRQSEDSPSGTTNVNLTLGDKVFPMTSKQSVADSFENEIKSINVVRGRKRNVY